jgi:hypothetical protein
MELAEKLKKALKGLPPELSKTVLEYSGGSLKKRRRRRRGRQKKVKAQQQ